MTKVVEVLSHVYQSSGLRRAHGSQSEAASGTSAYSAKPAWCTAYRPTNRTKRAPAAPPRNSKPLTFSRGNPHLTRRRQRGVPIAA